MTEQEAPQITEHNDAPEQAAASKVPTKEQMEAWKVQYGPIYTLMCAGIFFAWRGLRKREYLQIMQIAAQKAQEIQQARAKGQEISEEDEDFGPEVLIVDQVILWPDPGPDLRGKEGVVGTLSNAILYSSGYDPSPDIVEL